MTTNKYIEEGRALMPKPMTVKQISKFCQLNKYNSAIDLAWEKKKAEHSAYWFKIYDGQKIIMYPKLKVAWKTNKAKTKSVIAYKVIGWPEPAKIYLNSADVETKLRALCHAFYCRYNSLVEVDKPKGYFVFTSLPELFGY